LRIVTGCLRPAPADNIPILAGIQRAEFHRNGATLPLARHAMEPGHLHHSALTRPSSANARRLKSRHPFVPAAQQLTRLLSDNNNIRAAHWADHQFSEEWADNPLCFRLRTFITDTGNISLDMTLPTIAWFRLNPSHWCQTFPPLLVQMGYGLLCDL